MVIDKICYCNKILKRRNKLEICAYGIAVKLCRYDYSRSAEFRVARNNYLSVFLDGKPCRAIDNHIRI